MPVTPGTYNLNASLGVTDANGKSAGTYRMTSVVTGLVVNGNVTKNFVFTHPPVVTFSGKTTDANGTPVAGVSLNMMIDSVSTGISFSIPPILSTTGSDGSFREGLHKSAPQPPRALSDDETNKPRHHRI